MKLNHLLALLLLITSCSKNPYSLYGHKPESVFLSALLGDGPAEQAEPHFTLLSDKRSDMKAPVMSMDEKLVLVVQARLVLGQIYVNRLKKMTDFGIEVDPVTQLDSFEKNNMDADSDVFHEKLSAIFLSQKDYHTWYELPVPVACYSSFLPFSVSPAKSTSMENISVVRSIKESEQIYNLVPDLKMVSLGDVLVAVNGKSTEEAISDLNQLSRGANPGALRRGANSLLTYRGHWSLPIPKSDSVSLEFKKADSTTYKVTMPWLVASNEECLSVEKSLKPKIKKDKTFTADNRFVTEYEKFYKKTKSEKSLAHSLVNDTAEPTIHWWILNNKNGSFGVLRLDSFSPEKVSDGEAKKIVTDLFNNQFQNLDGVIFDLRNNGGGSIGYGESLAELITAKSLDVLKFQLLNSKANYHFFSNAQPESEYFVALKEAMEKATVMTAALPLVKGSSIYTKGQSLFKPVALFTNSSCYSTCDIMSALFQDHQIAEVWGEDLQTGAGGANNWNLNELIKSLPADKLGPFSALPNKQNMGFAFRQTLRSATHLGELLEDAGVKSEHVIAPTIQDIIDGGRSQFFKISASLAAKKNQYTAWGNFNKSFNSDTAQESLELILDFKGTDTIKVFSNKLELASVQVSNSVDSQSVTLPVNLSQLNKNNGIVEVIGFSNGARVWRRLTDFRIIPTSTKLGKDEVLTFDFKDSISPFAIFNNKNIDSEGWHLEDNALRIGSTKNYVDDLNSTASLFIDLANKENANLSFNLESYTEKDFDYISVQVLSEGSAFDLIKATSGNLADQKYEFDLSAYKGKIIEIRINFNSDGGVTDKGVWLRNLILK